MKKVMCYTSVFLLLLLTLTGCSNGEKDWAFGFVVFENNSYKVSDQKIDHVDEELGKVDKYVTKEATYQYKGTFSNAYPVGTKILKISNVDSSEAIAVEVSGGVYLQADNQGEYGK